eukprot:1185188-Prorocentrum_minimum.AAC.1
MSGMVLFIPPLPSQRRLLCSNDVQHTLKTPLVFFALSPRFRGYTRRLDLTVKGPPLTLLCPPPWSGRGGGGGDRGAAVAAAAVSGGATGAV